MVLKPDLTLEWKRLIDIPTNDSSTVNYTVVINSTEIKEMTFVNFTSMTSLSVRFIEEMLTARGSQCVKFEFSVSGMNEAGTGPPARITDTLPLCERMKVNILVINYVTFINYDVLICAAPDVRNISNEFVVHDVNLVMSTMMISFLVSRKSLLSCLLVE